MSMLKTFAALAVCTGLTLPASAANVTIKRQKAGQYKAVTTYPAPDKNSPLAGLAERTYVKWAKDDLARFVRDSEKTFKDIGKFNAPYEYLMKGKITYNSPHLMSVWFDGYEYMGGAHGMSPYYGFTLGSVGGKQRLLRLADFFRPGAKYA